MNVTSKSRYALKIMMDLAAEAGSHGELSLLGIGSAGDGPSPVIQRGAIASRQGIPLDYMDHILQRLRDAGLIASVRGRSGGYSLGRAADSITVHDIFKAVEDAWHPVQCLEGGEGCQAEHICSSKDAWSHISAAITGTLSGIILAELVEGPKSSTQNAAQGAAAWQGLYECRAPRRAPSRRRQESRS